MATTDKYDRQLRLWGAKGQRALGETTLVLIRATAVGTETLKNLVLPGVGHFLIVDDAATIGKEYSSNFFLTEDDSKTRAEMACELMQEMNPDVKGNWLHVSEPLTKACAKEEWWKSLWKSVSNTPRVLVIGSDLEPPLLQLVGQACYEHWTPLISVQSYGLLGLCRLQTPALPLMDPKPDSAPPDLRLVRPFPRLQQLADNIQLDNLQDHEHGHVAYPIILIKVAQEWKATHNGCLPKTPAEKQEFRNAIKLAARDINKEINFEEATQNAYLAYTEKELDLDHLASLRDQINALVETHTSLKNFQALLQALDQFLQRHDNQPPLHGTIPDMTASTEWYVEMQRVYHDKAAEDLKEMRSYLPHEVPDEELATFCQNVHSLELFHTRTIQEEMTPTITEDLKDDWMMATMDPYEMPEHTPFLWYIAFRACQLFFQKNGRYPGVTDAYQEDVAPVHDCTVEIVNAMELQENSLVQETLLANNKFAQELTRYGQSEVHPIASMIGGVASQEAVKVITGQYVPLNNTYIYNGVASVGGVYQF